MKRRKRKVKSFKIFDREGFYNSKQRGPFIEKSTKVRISTSTFKKYKNQSGVWAKYGIPKGKRKWICIDVLQHHDIGYEMEQSEETMKEAKKLTGLSQEEIRIRYPGIFRNAHINKYIKFNDLYSKISYHIVETGIKKKKDREKIEVKYAYKNKAVHWSPAPGYQKTLVRKYMIPFSQYKKKYLK